MSRQQSADLHCRRAEERNMHSNLCKGLFAIAMLLTTPVAQAQLNLKQA